MSLPTSSKMICSNCKSEDVYRDWLSTNSFSSDLDTRPIGDAREAYNQMKVKRCEKCGYCNSDLTLWFDRLHVVISSKEYQSQLVDEHFPEKANEFLCKSIILEFMCKVEEAAWASLHAAWNCDDAGKVTQSDYCRYRAINLFNLTVTAGCLTRQTPSEFAALLIDLYRRTGQFANATIICDIRIAFEKDEVLKNIVKYQLKLLQESNKKVATLMNVFM
jgi:hypothetical protein